ncbi:low molecular weight protein-tyrosine-phosphatase [Sphingomonas oryzagri]|uniref:protein-tyrosine-phosphatase n=1 Tax=Sphingomonas oryzagri TaxID=3042314 RepID=A0ABT6N725_9SPHN|nr:low molecular weight protein-tyrosine-phosphatase [Sphingomonas oryzagri]MDH7640896.1 low molecular weight protein-tyrosine-phosphatase [Sphingomonas oryzagri]
MADLHAVLFVCMGNICRSPLAEAAFRDVAVRLNLHVEVDSAGTGGWHAGDPPDARAQAEALRHGIDISNYRARQVTQDDFRRFTHILALDSDNLADLRAIAPSGATAWLGLLLDHADGRAGESVADPYYGKRADFEQTWRDVSAAAEGLGRALAQS